MKRTLKEIFAEIGNFGEGIGCNDKGSTHTYLETYDKFFEPFQRNGRILEIGLAAGDSIKLFDEYFEDSDIVGIDLTLTITPLEYKNNVALFEGDGTKKKFLNQIKDYEFDIIVDDGSHIVAEQLASFKLLKHKMAKGGVYIIEDILDLDHNRHKFEMLHDNCEIIDMRDNGRFDNILIIYRF